MIKYRRLIIFKYKENCNKIQVCTEFPFDDFRIEKIEIKDNKLIIDVVYSGGFCEHDFGLCWDGKVRGAIIPKVILNLAHNAKNDRAEALKHKKLEFDISDLDKNSIIFVSNYGKCVKYE